MTAPGPPPPPPRVTVHRESDLGWLVVDVLLWVCGVLAAVWLVVKW